jgi:hypothetical protein
MKTITNTAGNPGPGVQWCHPCSSTGATYLFYASTKSGPAFLLPLYALVGLTVGVVSVVPSIMVKSFPSAIRFSGIALSYNISFAIFGGLTPLIVAIFPANDLFGAAHYVAALCLVGFAIGLFLGKNRIRGLQLPPRGLAAHPLLRSPG